MTNEQQQDSASIRRRVLVLFAHPARWGDDKAYFSAARERIENLEKIMLAELGGDEVRDEGWDAESLRQEFGGSSKKGLS